MRNDARPIGEDSSASPVGGQHQPLERQPEGKREPPKPAHDTRDAKGERKPR